MVVAYALVMMPDDVTVSDVARFGLMSTVVVALHLSPAVLMTHSDLTAVVVWSTVIVIVVVVVVGVVVVSVVFEEVKSN